MGNGHVISQQRVCSNKHIGQGNLFSDEEKECYVFSSGGARLERCPLPVSPLPAEIVNRDLSIITVLVCTYLTSAR